jgi:hypothetical protein
LKSNYENEIDYSRGPAKWLRLLLAIIGCGLLVATFAIFLPVKLMATIHQWLGLGEFPDSPITIYLARSTSLLYAVHGLLMLVVSFDMKRYWPLVPIFCWLHVVIGLTMFGIDLTSPMPIYWIVGEGLPIAATGLFKIWLWKKACRGSLKSD